MIRIIKGVRYDTKASPRIGVGTSKIKDKTSPEWWRATLYQRPLAGDFFIVGKGNSMTAFRGKEKLIPLGPEQGQVWASWFLSPDVYRQHFKTQEKAQ
jgi:hypothetical protein